MDAPDKIAIEELKELFYTADLAKFAKLQTLLSENDVNLLKAMNFINATKLEEKEEISGKKKAAEIPQEVKRTNRDRLILKSAIVVVLVLCLGVLIEIGRSVYNLLY